MKRTSILAAALAALSLAVPATASAATFYTGFETMGPLVFPGGTPYVDGGVSVESLGLGAASNGVHNGLYSWTTDAFDTKPTIIRRADGGAFDTIDFVAARWGGFTFDSSITLRYDTFRLGHWTASGSFSHLTNTALQPYHINCRGCDILILRGYTPVTPTFGGVGSLDDIKLTALGGVPEPTTWALMLVGFFGLGGVLRRARKPAAIA